MATPPNSYSKLSSTLLWYEGYFDGEVWKALEKSNYLTLQMRNMKSKEVL